MDGITARTTGFVGFLGALWFAIRNFAHASLLAVAFGAAIALVGTVIALGIRLVLEAVDLLRGVAGL